MLIKSLDLTSNLKEILGKHMLNNVNRETLVKSKMWDSYKTDDFISIANVRHEKFGRFVLLQNTKALINITLCENCICFQNQIKFKMTFFTGKTECCLSDKGYYGMINFVECNQGAVTVHFKRSYL